MNRKMKIATLLFICFALTVTLVWATTMKDLATIPTDGTVTEPSVGVTPSTVHWGNVTVNVPNLQTIEVTNMGPLDITNLHLTYTLPEAFDATLTWDLEGTSLNVAQSTFAQLNLTLTVAPEGPFTFDIHIQGEC